NPRTPYVLLTCATHITSARDANRTHVGAGVPGVGQRRDLDHVAGVGSVDEQATAYVDADVAQIRVEEDQIAGRELVAAHVRAGVPQVAGVVGEGHSELSVDVYDKAG